MCDESAGAGTTTKTVKQLKELNSKPNFDGEHERYWSKERIAEVYGGPVDKSTSS